MNRRRCSNQCVGDESAIMYNKSQKMLFRLRRPCKHENNDDVRVLGLAPCHHSEKSQVRQTDQVWYHHQLQVSSLAVDLQWCYCPLHGKTNATWKFYIYADVSHTQFTHTYTYLSMDTHTYIHIIHIHIHTHTFTLKLYVVSFCCVNLY